MCPCCCCCLDDAFYGFDTVLPFDISDAELESFITVLILRQIDDLGEIEYE